MLRRNERTAVRAGGRAEGGRGLKQGVGVSERLSNHNSLLRWFIAPPGSEKVGSEPPTLTLTPPTPGKGVRAQVESVGGTERGSAVCRRRAVRGRGRGPEEPGGSRVTPCTCDGSSVAGLRSGGGEVGGGWGGRRQQVQLVRECVEGGRGEGELSEGERELRGREGARES